LNFPSRPFQRQALAAKLLDIGKSLLRQTGVEGSGVEGARARDSVKWVQKAFTVTEQVDNAECPGLAELKVNPPCSPGLFNTDLTLITAVHPENVGLVRWIRDGHFPIRLLSH
jgi:hypothetical protein